MIRIVVAVLALAFVIPAAMAGEKENYYYPPVSSEEVFSRALTAGPTAGRAVRVGFTTQITKAQLAAPESPRFVIFAKGEEAQHMILVALDDQVFKTLFRARAVLAQLTANLRSTEFFIENGIENRATWFDLARLLGFEDIVISDGETWSHRVVIE